MQALIEIAHFFRTLLTVLKSCRLAGGAGKRGRARSADGMTTQKKPTQLDLYRFICSYCGARELVEGKLATDAYGMCENCLDAWREDPESFRLECEEIWNEQNDGVPFGFGHDRQRKEPLK